MALMAAIAAAAVGGIASGAMSGAMGGKGGGGGGGGGMMPQAGNISQGVGGSILKQASGPISNMAAQLASRGIRGAMGPPGNFGQKDEAGYQQQRAGERDSSPFTPPGAQAPNQMAPWLPPNANPQLLAQMFQQQVGVPPAQFDPTTAYGGYSG